MTIWEIRRGRFPGSRWIALSAWFVLLHAAFNANGERLAAAEEPPGLMQTPVIDERRVEALRDELRALGLGSKPYDDVVRAVLERNSPDLAFRLLVDYPTEDFAGSIYRGNLLHVQLVHLAERTGCGPLVGGYREGDFGLALTARHPETFAYLVRNFPCRAHNERWLVEAARCDLPQSVALLIELYGKQPTPRVPVEGEISENVEDGQPEFEPASDNSPNDGAKEKTPQAEIEISWLARQYPDALEKAIYANSLESVRHLLNAGADLHSLQGEHWATPLQLAVWQGHEEIAALLLERGAMLDVYTAAGLGRLDDLKRLQREPLPQITPRAFGPHPLFWAARRGRDQCVRHLLDAGADVNAVGHMGWTPLHAAVDSGSVATVRLLLDRGADPLAECEKYHRHLYYYQLAPIHFAASAGNLPMVRLFVERGVSPWLRGNISKYRTRTADDWGPVTDREWYRVSVLAAAVRAEQWEVVDYLLERAAAELKADPPTLAAVDSEEALVVAASRGDVERCRALLEAGAALDGGEYAQHAQPLQAAAEAGKLEMVKFLLDRGAKVDGVGANTSQTPLHAAARQGHVAIAKLLLNKGAAVDARRPALPARRDPNAAPFGRLRNQIPASHPGARPLMLAALGGHPEVVELLLEHGANPDLERTEEKPDFAPPTTYDGAPRVESPLEAALAPRSSWHDRAPELKSARLLIAAGARLDAERAKELLKQTRDAERSTRERPQDITDDDRVHSEAMRRLKRLYERYELLERAGVAIDPQKFPEHRSLDWAVRVGDRELAQARIAAGEDPRQFLQKQGEGSYPKSPFERARERGMYLQLARMIELCAGEPLPIGYKPGVSTSETGPDCSSLFRYYGARPLPRTTLPLNRAIANGNMETVKRLLEEDYDLHQKDEHGRSPIMTAISYKKLELVQLLFERGASVEREPDGGRQMLLSALNGSRGRTDIVAFLLEKGADPSGGAPDELSPLRAAVGGGNMAAAQLLLERNARHDVFTAAAMGDARSLDEILDDDPEQIRQVQGRGGTPLLSALRNGQKETAALLFSRGAALDQSETQLHAVVQSGNVELFDWYLETALHHEFDYALRTSALHAAIHPCPRPGMVRHLLKLGATPLADPNLLIMAARHGSVEIIELLVAAGADVNATVRHDGSGANRIPKSALSAALSEEPPRKSLHSARETDEEAYRLSPREPQRAALRLLELGAYPRFGCPGIVRDAALTGNVDLVRKLLQARANPHDTENLRMHAEDVSALHHAVVRCHSYLRGPADKRAPALELLDVLLEYGASPRQTSGNRGGRSPLDFAKEYHDDEVIERLNKAPWPQPPWRQ